jgi:hypothetical protein
VELEACIMHFGDGNVETDALYVAANIVAVEARLFCWS